MRRGTLWTLLHPESTGFIPRLRRGSPAEPARPRGFSAAVRGERFALLPLPTLLELKLASGMTAPHRLRDLADVIELIRVNALGEELVESLHPPAL